jgi:transcriptional regulator with XRE-family HTH domain
MQKGYTLEQVSIAAGLRANGELLLRFEHGQALPTEHALSRLAVALGVDVLDLVNFPERGLRNQLAEATRNLSEPQLAELMAQVRALRAKREPVSTNPDPEE